MNKTSPIPGSSKSSAPLPLDTSVIVSEGSNTLVPESGFNSRHNLVGTTNLRADRQDRGCENVLSPMTFKNMQDELNAFMRDLQIQETLFQEQIEMVVGSDKALCSSFEKIVKVQINVDTLRGDRVRLKDAVEFLKSQQEEMEQNLITVESTLSDRIHEMEPNRKRLNQLTEDVNCQLVNIGRDLHSVIQHVNEQNKKMSAKDCSVSTILKILNEHTNILTGLEESCDKVKKSLNISETSQKR